MGRFSICCQDRFLTGAAARKGMSVFRLALCKKQRNVSRILMCPLRLAGSIVGWREWKNPAATQYLSGCEWP